MCLFEKNNKNTHSTLQVRTLGFKDTTKCIGAVSRGPTNLNKVKNCDINNQIESPKYVREVLPTLFMKGP